MGLSHEDWEVGPSRKKLGSSKRARVPNGHSLVRSVHGGRREQPSTKLLTPMHSRKDDDGNELADSIVPVTALEVQGRFIHSGVRDGYNSVDAKLLFNKSSCVEDQIQTLGTDGVLSLVHTQTTNEGTLTETTSTYELPVVGYVKRDRDAKWRSGVLPREYQRQECDRSFTFKGVTYVRPQPDALYYWDGTHQRPTLFIVPANEAPTNMKHEQRLQTGASLHSRTQRSAYSYRSAWVWKKEGWSAAKEDDGQEWLEVDLGAECRVTGISTKGGAPPTSLWPSHQQRDPGSFVAGAADSALRQAWPKHWGQYSMVGHLQQPQEIADSGEWVERYELLGRTSGGKTWFAIGKFNGNRDMTTEVAHCLRTFSDRGTGLPVRYLRFRPLGKAEGGFHRWKTMRVCVFGSRPGDDCCGDKRGRTRSKIARAGSRVLLLPETVTYRVVKSKEHAFARKCGPSDHKGDWGASLVIAHETEQRELKKTLRARVKSGTVYKAY